MRGKKTNPRRKPLSEAEFNRRQKEANTRNMMGLALIAYLTVEDVFSPEPDKMLEFHDKFLLNGELINSGKINVAMTAETLRQDYGLTMTFE